jgi:hypothetical protein
MNTPACVVSGFARRALPLLAVGLLGIVALLLQPAPPALLDAAPHLARWPELGRRAVMAVNPVILMVVSCLVGAGVAHRAGLSSLLAGTASVHGMRRAFGFSALVGLALGAAVLAADAAFTSWLGDAWRDLVQRHETTPWHNLVIGMLYGGISEEIIARWGLMSLLLWLFASLPGVHSRAWAAGWAIGLSALAFGAAHLPVLAVQIELDAAIVARTLLLNGMAGVVYGWLFWRYHLEAAMAAHAATHLGLLSLRALLG